MLDHPAEAEFGYRNRLLARFTQADYEQLRPELKLIALRERAVLCEPQKPIDSAYFIESGVASLVVTMRNGKTAEVGTIGNEGFVGLPIVFGEDVATVGVYMLVPGAALRLPAQSLRRQIKHSPSLQAVLLRYANAFLTQVAQFAACASMHSLEMRCCRWLLGARDRMPSDQFLLTQEFLAMMLGVRRSSVSAVMGALQKKRLIRYSRGQITILDRAALEKAACECYQVTKAEFDRVLRADTSA
jgi:CRP-like cAMP-binding protein